MSAIDWAPTRDLLAKHRRFLLTTHVNPEPDAIGSEIALAEMLRTEGKEVAIWNTSATPRNCAFLDPEGRIKSWTGEDLGLASWADMIVILDVNSWTNIGAVGDVIRASDRPRALIDHHRGGDADIAGTRVADISAAATGVLIYELAAFAKWPVAPRTAEALFAAICVDTGSFRFGNTDPRTLRVAADLVAAGAKPAEIYAHIFEDVSWARLRLLPLALSTLRGEADGRVAWMAISHAMYQEAGATEEDSDRFVDQIRGLRGVEACAVFRELPDGAVKVSLRSMGRVDVQQVAAGFGGGGHRLAAGANLAGPLDAATRRVVGALERAVTSG